MNQALAEAGGQDVDDLLLEVNKVLHTRFKNMYEGEMLLPNLAANAAADRSQSGALFL